MFFAIYSDTLLAKNKNLAGDRSGLILIPSGGFYLNPWPSNLSSKTKLSKIWDAGADGLISSLEAKDSHFHGDLTTGAGAI